MIEPTQTYEPVVINNKRYVPIDVLIVSGHEESEELLSLLKHLGGFMQQIKKINRGFLGPTYSIVVCLVPEENIIEFCNACN